MTVGVQGGPSPSAQSATVPFSLDGLARVDTMPRTKAMSRYVHYRLYAKGGPLDSHNPLYCNNSSIGRILSKSVPPPRTVASLKRHLCRIEGFEEPDNCDLYLSLSEKVALDNSTHLPLREDPAPGSQESEPIVLVVDVAAAGERSEATSAVQPTKRLDDEEPRYVYYRVYDENGEVASKTSFDDVDTSLGRIDTLSVPPPRIVASLKCRLLKAEEIPDGRDIKIYDDEDSKDIMNDTDAVALDADTYPGIIEDQPVAIVSGLRRKRSAPQLSPSSKQFKTTGKCNWGDLSSYPGWHSYAAGDVLQTDGVLLTSPDSYNYKCYAAVNSSGKKAYVHQGHVKFI